MIKARPHQQQPPNPVTCMYCGERFNNARRWFQHVAAKWADEDPKHPKPAVET